MSVLDVSLTHYGLVFHGQMSSIHDVISREEYWLADFQFKHAGTDMGREFKFMKTYHPD